MKQITVDGHTYSSIAAAWREESPEGLPLITVRWRLNHDWGVLDAFRLPPVNPRVRRKFKELRG